MTVIVSTIIPAFNAERTIARAIDSALDQAYDGHEVVVVDDGSTDSTSAILRRYGDRVRVISQTNHGAAAARNTGVAHSTGEYLAFLDSDDLWMPGKLRTLVATLRSNPRASLAFSEYHLVTGDGADCGESAFGDDECLEQLMRQHPLPVHSFASGIVTSTWLVRREAFLRSGGFSEAFGRQGFEDSWLLVLLRELGDFEFVPARLTCYRVPASGEAADKYGHALAIFVSLVSKRYGARGEGLIRSARNLQCRWLLSKAAHQMNNGEKLGAVRNLVRIGRLQPSYFVSSEFASRLILPQNLKRVRALTGLRARVRS
jgi:glycosyltransferase involved in cell wall biosynthesis